MIAPVTSIAERRRRGDGRFHCPECGGSLFVVTTTLTQVIDGHGAPVPGGTANDSGSGSCVACGWFVEWA